MRRLSIVFYSLAAIALVAVGARELGFKPELPLTKVAGDSNKYGYYLASWRAGAMSDFPVFVELYPKAVEDGTGDFAERLFIVRMLSGDETGAKEAATALLKTRPSNVMAATYMSYLSFKTGDYKDADKRLRNLGTAGNNFMVRLLRAWTLAALDDYNGAMDILEGESEKRAFEKIALVHLGLLAAEVDNVKYANQSFTEAAALPLDIFDLENIAGYYAAQNRPEKAKLSVLEALKKSPSSISIAALLKRIERGWTPPAIDTPRKGYAKALFDISSLAFAVNNNQPGEAYMFYLDMALGLEPDMQVARLMKAEAYRKAGRSEIYKAMTDRISDSHHLKPITRINWAQELLAKGDDSGLGILKDMIKDNPSVMQPYVMIGDFYRKRGNHPRAIDWYSRGIKENPTSPLAPEAKLARAMAYEMSGKEDLALLDLEEASKGSQLPELMNYYGYMLINRGMDIDKGMRLIQMALSSEPSNPYYLDSYGWAHYKKGDYAEAVRLLEYAYALSQGNAIILSHLGDAYFAADRKAEARFAWGKALTNLEGGKWSEKITKAELLEKLKPPS